MVASTCVIDKDGGEVAADLLIAEASNIQARGVEQLADGSVAVLYTDAQPDQLGNAHSFLRVDVDHRQAARGPRRG